MTQETLRKVEAVLAGVGLIGGSVILGLALADLLFEIF